MIVSCASIAMAVIVDTSQFPFKTVLVMTVGGLCASLVDWFIRRNLVFSFNFIITRIFFSLIFFYSLSLYSGSQFLVR